MSTHRRARLAAYVGVLGLVATACAGSPSDVTDTTDGEVMAAHASVETPEDGMQVQEAAAIEEAPAAEPSPEPEPRTSPASVPATVDVRRPDLIVRAPADEPGTALYAAFGVEGVEHLAGVSQFTGVIPIDGERHKVTVLAVDPSTFRQLTPEVTAQEPSVWQRLAEGDVLVLHEVAHRLRLELGGTIELEGPAGPEARDEVRVGAFASNGAPPLADIIVPWDVGSQLGAAAVNTLIVSLEEGTAPEDTGEAMVAALGGGDYELREKPEKRQARIVHTPGRATIEPFSYTDLGDGMIVIDPAWVQKWIVTVDLPGLGRTRCHRTMAAQLIEALREVQEAGLYEHLKPDQFAGCYVPRHIDWSPSKPLSMHAWGLAIDFNSIDNALGKTPLMDRRIVAIFEKWGFEWGGWWSRPDGMHFELDRIIDVG